MLRRLGLGDQMAKAGFEPTAMRVLRWQDGSRLGEWPLAGRMRQEFGAPYYTVYRPDLIEVLASALPPDVVRLNCAVTDVEPHAAAVTLADGTHSTVRGATVGDAPARFSGMCAYRVLLPLQPGDDLSIRLWFGPGRHIVAYPVGRGPDWLSWTAPGTAADLREHFRDWSPALRALLERVIEPVFRWALYDREPFATWSTAATTLLGDAAHPMLPFLAQGAAQAIGDAGALAASLGGSVPATLGSGSATPISPPAGGSTRTGCPGCMGMTPLRDPSRPAREPPRRPAQPLPG